jgi:hypothetical protein
MKNLAIAGFFIWSVWRELKTWKIPVERADYFFFVLTVTLTSGLVGL